MLSVPFDSFQPQQRDHQHRQHHEQQRHYHDRIWQTPHVPVAKLRVHLLLEYHFIIMDKEKKEVGRGEDVLQGHYDFDDSEMLKI
jgi:hypothetical protein